MAFKADSSFLRFLTMGAIGVHRTMQILQKRGFHPVELERYCGSNKIWATKVKRLRLPDLLCVRTGLRLEVRAKSDLKVRMSDAPQNPERVWDAGLRDDDLVAFIACREADSTLVAAERAAFFRVAALRASAKRSKLGAPKSASEGSERDRTWPVTVPSRSGSVLEVSAEKLVVQMHADGDRPERRQTYRLKDRKAYVKPGEKFDAGVDIIAGLPDSMANLGSYLNRNYQPTKGLKNANVVDRYAAVKALRHREDPGRLAALEKLLQEAKLDNRVRLEAAGVAAALGSKAGQDAIGAFVWENAGGPELRMEAAFILSELGNAEFPADALRQIADSADLRGDEVREAAVWGLGMTGLRRYDMLLRFIGDEDEGVALHAITGFGRDTPRSVIEALIEDLIVGDAHRAPGASASLLNVGTDDVLDALISAARRQPVDWVLATLGRMPPEETRRRLAGSGLLRRIAPLLLTAPGANRLASEEVAERLASLRAQRVR
jgi:hypothetical protein